MRYYDINIGSGLKHYTSYVNGMTDPGALLVEMDVLVGPAHVPFGNSFVRVWGVSLQDIGQASDLNFKPIVVMGGMQKGLPLANPAQAGLLFQGQVIQAFGNWQGTTQTLDLLVTAGSSVGTVDYPQGRPSAPLNLSFNWQKGQPMATAIAATLKTALPSLKQNIAISPNLVFTETATGYYETLPQFAQIVNKLSKSIIGGTYQGVSISIQNNQISAFDGTQAGNATIQVAFNDLIGQVTWDASQQIIFKTVMRSDIAVGDMVKLPPGQVTTTAASLSQYRQGSVFQGVFQVTEVRHVGNSRNPSGDSWVTIARASGPIKQAAN